MRCHINHVATLAALFTRLHLHRLNLSRGKSRIRAARVDYLISVEGVRPNDDRVAAHSRMSMPTEIKQLLRSFLGDLSHYCKFLPNMAHRIRPNTTLLKKITFTMEDIVRVLLVELAAQMILVFPDCDVVTDKSGAFRLPCDTSIFCFGATLEQDLRNGSIHPIF